MGREENLLKFWGLVLNYTLKTSKTSLTLFDNRPGSTYLRHRVLKLFCGLGHGNPGTIGEFDATLNLYSAKTIESNINMY